MRPGREQGDPDNDHGLGRSRGGYGSKLHLMTERGGTPLAAILTSGQRHESTQALALLAATLERLWPDAVADDKAHSTSAMRTWLSGHEIEAVTPNRDDELGPKAYVRAVHRERPIIERTINRLKCYRRVATHCEKLATTNLAIVIIACILQWL